MISGPEIPSRSNPTHGFNFGSNFGSSGNSGSSGSSSSFGSSFGSFVSSSGNSAPVFDENKFKSDLKRHEGLRLDVYPDPVKGSKVPTVGYGHPVVEGDNLKIGDRVSPAGCNAFLGQDSQQAVAGARSVFPNFDRLPSEAQQITANMAYQMGPTG